MTTVTEFVAVSTESNLSVQDILSKVGGKVFTVTFTKADKSERVMNCRRQVVKHLKGGISTIKDKPKLVSVYDMQAQGYRCFNIDAVKSIKFGGKTYQF